MNDQPIYIPQPRGDDQQRRGARESARPAGEPSGAVLRGLAAVQTVYSDRYPSIGLQAIKLPVTRQELSDLIADLLQLGRHRDFDPEALIQSARASLPETVLDPHAEDADRVELTVDEHLTHTIVVSAAELDDEAPGWAAVVDGEDDAETVHDALARVVADRVSDRTVDSCENREITDWRRL